MKTRALLITAITLCVSGALVLPVMADAGHAQGTSQHEHDAKAGHSHDGHSHDHDAPKVDPAATSADMMTQIHDLHAKLKTTVSEKKLSDVHHLAFAIRDLAAELPTRIKEDKRSKVEATARNIAALASALDESGDAGDQAKTEANMKKLDGLLKMLETQVSNS